MLHVTETAREALTKYFKEHALDSSIRIYLAQGGCAGSSLALGLDQARNGDQSFDLDGLTFLVAKDLLGSVGALTVDFENQGCRSGFRVSSEIPLPAGPASCGSSCCSC